MSTSLADRPFQARVAEIVKAYWDLGFTSFGGPGVHVIILKRRFVTQLHWITPKTFADLFSLGNALPGPGSTQLAFSIAVIRGGTTAGLVGFLLWSLPAATAMSALAAAISHLPPTLPPPVLNLLTGLNAAAVGLIAVAAYQLSMNTIGDGVTRLLVFGSVGFGICYHAPWMYPVLVVTGGLTTLLYDFRSRWLSPILKHLTPRSRRQRAQRLQAADPGSAAGGGGAMSQGEGGIGESIELESLPREPQAVYRRQERTPLTPPPDEIRPVRVEQIGADDIQSKEKDEVGLMGVDLSTPTLLVSEPTAAIPPQVESGTTSIRNRRSLASQAEAQISAQAVPLPVQDQDPEEEDQELRTLGPKVAISLLVLFVVVIVTFVAVRAGLEQPGRALDFFTNMLIAGTIICGGGPVVIPLLRGYTVDPGWVSSRDFLLGFAVLQAWPGPNFAFASYLGVLSITSNPPLGAVLGFVGIFGPGILLKLALLPLYKKWREYAVAKSILRGLNASAVGLIYTAVWQLFLVGHIYTSASGETSTSVSGPLTADPWWAVVAGASFMATEFFKVPPAISVLSGGACGLLYHAVTSK